MKYPLTVDQQCAADKVQKLLRLKSITKRDSRELHDHGVWMEYESATDPARLAEQLELIFAFTWPLVKSEAYKTISKSKGLTEQLALLVDLSQRVASQVNGAILLAADTAAWRERGDK